MASADTQFRIEALVRGVENVEGLKSAIKSLQGSATPAASDLNRLRDAAVALGSASNASENNLRSAVNTLKSLKDQASIASSEYRQFAQDIKLVENRLNSVTQAATQFKSASSGIASGGNAGARLGPGKATYGAYGQMPFQSFDPEFWRKQVEEPGLGSFNQPQQFNYVKGEQAINQLEDSIDKISELKKRARIEQLETQEKYNQLEIEAENRKQQAYLRQQKAGADAAGADYMRRLEATDKRKARTRGFGQSAGIVAASGIFGGPEGALGAIGGAFLGGPAGAALGGAVGAQVGILRQQSAGIAEYAAKLNLAKITLAQASSGQSEYNQQLQTARSISKDYSVGLVETIQGYSQIAVAAKANGLTLKETEKIYRGAIASGVAFGKSQEDLDAIIRATTQVLSKGKLSAEELQGQIGERLPGAVAKFAASTGRTLPELADALENGKVTIADFVTFSKKQFEDYDELARIIGASPEKAGARLKNALDTAAENYGGFFQLVGSKFQDFSTKIIMFFNQNTEGTKRFVTFFINSLKIVVDAIDVVVKKIASLKLGLGDLGEGFKKYTDNYKDYFPEFKPGAGMFGANASGQRSDQIDNSVQKEAEVLSQIIRRRDQYYAAEISIKEKILSIDQELFVAQENNNKALEKKLQKQKIDFEYTSKRNALILKEDEAIARFSISKDPNKQFQLQMIERETTFNLNALVKERQKALQDVDQNRVRESRKQLDSAKKSATTAAEQLIILKEGSTLEAIRLEYAAKRSNLEQEISDKLKKQQGIQETQAINEEKNSKMQILRLQEIQAIANESSKIWADEISALGTTLSDYFNTLETASPILDNIASTIGDGIGSAMESLVSNTKSWGDSLREIGSSVLKDIAKQLLQMSVVGPATKGISGLLGSLFPTAIKAIVPGLSAVGGPAFGMNAASVDVNQAFKLPSLMANGGVMTPMGPMPLKRYANGGVANSPQMAVYGEGSRPEAYVPLPDGRRIPVALQGGGGANVVVNVDAQGTNVQGNRPDAQQLGRAVAGAVQAELIKQRRPGGLLAA